MKSSLSLGEVRRLKRTLSALSLHTCISTLEVIQSVQHENCHTQILYVLQQKVEASGVLGKRLPRLWWPCLPSPTVMEL